MMTSATRATTILRVGLGLFLVLSLALMLDMNSVEWCLLTLVAATALGAVALRAHRRV